MDHVIQVFAVNSVLVADGNRWKVLLVGRQTCDRSHHLELVILLCQHHEPNEGPYRSSNENEGPNHSEELALVIAQLNQATDLSKGDSPLPFSLTSLESGRLLVHSGQV